MDVLLDVATPEPTMGGTHCSAGVDLCGQHSHDLSLPCAELNCREPESLEEQGGWHCQKGLQNCEPLQQVTWKHDIIKEAQQSAAHHILNQSEKTEEQIKEEFEKLRQFLKREEEARIATMREEEETKRRKAMDESEKMNKLIQALKDTIKDIETEVEGDEVTFLQHYERTIKRTWKDLQHPKKKYDSLLDVPKHVGNLRFRVWEKMKDICPHTPVTVDPNTASCSLSISEPLNSIRYRGRNNPPERPLLPTVPERFHPYAAALGSESVVSSELHQWDMEVGDSTNWTVGVAYGSIKRREEFEACPEAGLWTIGLRDGVYLVMMSPCEVIPLDGDSQRPRVVRVSVDCNAGKVCFSDAERDTHLFTFTHTFTEPLYPYFETICKEHPLVVRPKRVCVLVEELNPPHQDQSDEATSEHEQPSS